MSISAKFNVGRSPYGDVVPQEKLLEIVRDLVGIAAEQVAGLFREQEVPRRSFGLCILNPAAPYWKPSIECVLAVAAIGDEGEALVPNALAKAFLTRDSGTEAGALIYSQPHRIPGGAFRWGHSANVDGTIVGGSGFKEKDDQALCQFVGTIFNSEITDVFEQWNEKTPRRGADGISHSWFTATGKPPEKLLGHPLLDFENATDMQVAAD